MKVVSSGFLPSFYSENPLQIERPAGESYYSEEGKIITNIYSKYPPVTIYQLYESVNFFLYSFGLTPNSSLKYFRKYLGSLKPTW